MIVYEFQTIQIKYYECEHYRRFIIFFIAIETMVIILLGNKG